MVDQADAPAPAGAGGAAAASPSPTLDEHIDIRHTEPAPDVKTDVDRLTDAFPGAELLQEET